MTLQLLTPIYPPEIKPVRDGWYLGRRRPWMVWSLFEWQQQRWWFADVGREAEAPILSGWRGLAFDPDGARPHTFITPVRWDNGCFGDLRESGVFLPGAECS